jgi:hypothetical protein
MKVMHTWRLYAYFLQKVDRYLLTSPWSRYY